MIINAFKNKIFPFGVEEPEDLGKRPDQSDKSDESNESDESYIPKEATTRDEISDFDIRKMSKNEKNASRYV